MNFSKLKLTENAAGVAVTSNNPATRNSAQSAANASGPGQSGMKQGTVNAQAGQSMQSATNTGMKKQSPIKSGTQVNAGGPTNIQSSYDATKANVELVKMREAAKCDWRQELMEAANPNDDPNHPFVEVMPYNDFRMKEAQKLMVKAAAKDKAQAQGMQEAAVDYTTQKKKSGKAIAKGKSCGDMPVKNSDNTATPKENQMRRNVNKKPSLRGDMGKKIVDGMKTDAFSNK